MLKLLSGQLGDNSVTPIGTHCILELYGCPSSLLDDPAFITQALRDAAVAAEATLLSEVVHEFDPQGVTGLALLSESHISIHTWPEMHYAAVDVFTCGSSKPEKGCYYLMEVLQASDHSLQVIKRRPPAVPGTRIPAAAVAMAG
ncbi:MAG: adenosylmethionine decarboxylase [Prochlorothrix sp.]|nr:adenosylmethionine decarboxylase [Prochlorothrix sp.]